MLEISGFDFNADGICYRPLRIARNKTVAYSYDCVIRKLKTSARHKNNVHLIALTSLVHAYQRQDIVAFEDILAQNRSQIMEDPFICIYIEEVLRAIRSQVLVNLLRPYSRVSLPYVAEYLKITLDEVESLLMSLIQDSRLDGRLNQQLSLYEMDYSLDNRERYDAITTFAGNVTKMCESMGNCVRVPTNA